MDFTRLTLYIALTLIFGAYVALAKRPLSKLPEIPFGLIILYFLLKISALIFAYAKIENTATSLEIAAIIVAWMFIVRFVVYIALDYFMRQRRGLNIPTITRDFGLGLVFVIIAMVVIKQKTDINIGSLLTTSAILTAVIGFAMQDTLGNLISGLAIQLEHPYQIGDWIGVANVEGTVQGITWKSTRILTRSQEMVFIPNSTISKSVLINFSRPTISHKGSIEIMASFDHPPHKVKQALLSIMLEHPKIVSNPPPLVRIAKYGDSSIVYKATFTTPNFEFEGWVKSDLLSAIWYKFHREGIKIPFPIYESLEILAGDAKEKQQLERADEEEIMDDILSKIDIFAGLSPEVKKEFIPTLAVLQFAAGETIVRQGDEPGPMYVIKEGECSIILKIEGGVETEVAKLKSRQFFGEMSLLTGAPRSATVKALTDTVCYEIEKRDMMVVFKSNPAVLTNISDVLASRQMALDVHKTKTEEELRLTEERKKQLTAKIMAFFGI